FHRFKSHDFPTPLAARRGVSLNVHFIAGAHASTVRLDHRDFISCALLKRSGTRAKKRQEDDKGEIMLPLGGPVSALVAAADGGDRPAEALFTTLYSELHRIARRELGRRPYDGMLGATSLLHEAYLELSRRETASFPDERRFMAYAARVMRGLIIDYVRN